MTATTTAPARAGTSASRHALLVEDDPLMRDMIADLLGDVGVGRVTAARDGHEALDLLGGNARGADLVVCDLNMPRCDGFEFMARLADRGFAGRVLLVSGMNARTMNSAELMGRFHRLQVVGSLPKPVDRAKLASLVGRHAA